MHSLAKKHFERVLKDYKPLGLDRNCKAYPCHANLEDCSWCYCPFYPCQDESLGNWIRAATWSCENCEWIHRQDVAGEVMNELKNLGINKPQDIESSRYELKDIKERIKVKHPISMFSHKSL